MQQIPFIDLAAQQQRIQPEVQEKIAAVLAHGQYIMGPEVRELEEKIANFAGTKHALSCSNGSDALLLALMALEIGPGDAVYVPSFTFAATAEMVALTGATPVFVDVQPDTFNMDPAHLTASIKHIANTTELTSKAVIAVDLFGQIANYPEIAKTSKAHNLTLISDAAQGFGATLNDQQAGDFAEIVTTSFFPAKPLGCYGDGGAVLTNNDDLQEKFISLRNHGQGKDRYDNVRIGLNARLDSIQAAVLLLKLDIFPDEINTRNEIAARYNEGLKDLVTTPVELANTISTWAQYTIKTPSRDQLAANLKDQNIPTAIYYAKPLHQQTAYKNYPQGGGALPVTDQLAKEVISLPMHPYLKPEVQDKIIEAITRSIKEN